MPRDFEALGRRILRPHRAQLDAALAIAREHPLPRAAWEACAARGLIPTDWASDTARGPGRVCWGCFGAGQVEGYDQYVSLGYFPDTPCHGRGFLDEDNRGEYGFDGDAGWTHALVAALAADPAGVAHAETLAREVAARVLPFDPTVRTCVRWSTMRERWGIREMRGDRFAALLERAGLVLTPPPEIASEVAAATAAVVRGAARVESSAVERAVADVAAALAWASRSDEPAIRGNPSPFEPLLDLWETGYVLDGLAGAAICLIAPAP